MHKCSDDFPSSHLINNNLVERQQSQTCWRLEAAREESRHLRVEQPERLGAGRGGGGGGEINNEQ